MNQQDAQSDERFVAVHVGIDQLNPNQPQIMDIVQPFLPPDCKFLFALNVTREIVNGLRYEIIFVMRNERDDEIYCEMDVIEKPWLIRDSRKYRKMTYNNCSLANPTDDDDRRRFQYETNPTFVNQRTELTQSEMIDLEDLIVTIKPRAMITTTTESPETTLAPLDQSSKNLLDDFFNMNNYFPPPPVPITTTSTSTLPPLSNSNMDALDEMFGIKKVENSFAEPRTESSTDSESIEQKQVENVNASPSSNETALKELESDIKKVFSELFQSDPDFQSNIIALINRKDDLAGHGNYNYVINTLAIKLKDKIESYNERHNVEVVTEGANGEEESTNEGHNVEVTTDGANGDGDGGRKKRSNSNRIWDLAEVALDTLDHIDADDHKRILINILKVDGRENSFKIEATVANSRCEENSHEVSDCEEKIDRQSMKVCLLEVKV